ncbi:MAG: 50S ribosomal protein L17 [Syntrophobacteraceae bacterium]|nr:50S ribosomal protein L17 [Syntrophobacteraceae bacterium]
MRHGVSGRKLNRSTSHRFAMFRNMVTSLLRHERIFTTVPKAKELRRWCDWMITLGKRGDLHARRQALSLLREKNIAHRLFEELAPRYVNRQGGYTRIIKVGFRRGDAAPMCLIELVTESPQGVKKPGHKKRETPAPAAAPGPDASSVPSEEGSAEPGAGKE